MTPLEFFIYGTIAVLAWWLLLEVSERSRTEWHPLGRCPKCGRALIPYPACNECDSCGYCDDGQPAEAHA
ncbi:hypothetical protein SAMN06295943_2897 [Agreia sp. VKM Ac-1783]|nr:hypothetical protein SAMN06295943_2897 [Agreia sp. VKM Ac-1783]